MARRNHTISEYVQAHLAAANPFYPGAGAEAAAPSRDEHIVPLDPRKTAEDLGHTEPETRARLERLARAGHLDDDALSRGE